ncbi:MAG TPA: zinc-binding dehydrogenase [Flexivirga sp.]|uniref:zinc-binding dehydrogenase n=1 Tax=Flexivirga sp. TaxID=1962927 RepID=UPI002B899E8F|nr:zinc-binding dehydrogenase [Flexivirga sp.]HWC22318.1 zinc-binding dehydrogenase [Flexivirga sp.]
MWAYMLESPAQLSRTTAPRPSRETLAEGHVIARLLAGSVCGSDVSHFLGEWDRGPDRRRVAGYPMHEVVGEVIASTDDNFPLGTKIVGWAEHSTGLAEEFVAATHSIHALPASTNPVYSTIAQPLACVLFSVARLPDPAGKRAAVLGQGPLGLLFSHVLADAGAHVAGVDRVDRADAAPKFGVKESIWDSTHRWARTLDDASRPEIVVESIGHQAATVDDAIEALSYGGTVFAFGVPDQRYYALNFQRLFRKQAILMGGVTENRHYWLGEALRYLERHPELADDYITHIFPIERAQDAYALAATPCAGRFKVALRVSN